MKSWFRDAITCTEATILDSESCHTCNSCTDRTPSTFRMDPRTSSRDIAGGTPWRRMKDALSTKTGEPMPKIQVRKYTYPMAEQTKK